MTLAKRGWKDNLPGLAMAMVGSPRWSRKEFLIAGGIFGWTNLTTMSPLSKCHLYVKAPSQRPCSWVIQPEIIRGCQTVNDFSQIVLWALAQRQFGGKKTSRKCSRFFCMLMNRRPRVIWSKSNEGRSRAEGPRPELDLDQITRGLRFISIQKNREHFLRVFFPPNDSLVPGVW